MDHRTPMKVTTLEDGTQLQYIKVADSIEPRWICSADSLLTTNRPEHALGMLPSEAIQLCRKLYRLGYEGLSLTNGLPLRVSAEIPCSRS